MDRQIHCAGTLQRERLNRKGGGADSPCKSQQRTQVVDRRGLRGNSVSLLFTTKCIAVAARSAPLPRDAMCTLQTAPVERRFGFILELLYEKYLEKIFTRKQLEINPHSRLCFPGLLTQ